MVNIYGLPFPLNAVLVKVVEILISNVPLLIAFSFRWQNEINLKNDKDN
jgi:hypothetical protein